MLKGSTHSLKMFYKKKWNFEKELLLSHFLKLNFPSTKKRKTIERYSSLM